MDSDGLIRLAHVNDIPEGAARIIPLPSGEEIALFHVQGKYFALENTCPHMGGPLAEGEVENLCVTCPWHGWQFDLSSGECINCPGDDAKAYPLLIQGDEIFIKASS